MKTASCITSFKLEKDDMRFINSIEVEGEYRCLLNKFAWDEPTQTVLVDLEGVPRNGTEDSILCLDELLKEKCVKNKDKKNEKKTKEAN